MGHLLFHERTQDRNLTAAFLRMHRAENRDENEEERPTVVQTIVDTLYKVRHLIAATAVLVGFGTATASVVSTTARVEAVKEVTGMSPHMLRFSMALMGTVLGLMGLAMSAKELRELWNKHRSFALEEENADLKKQLAEAQERISNFVRQVSHLEQTIADLKVDLDLAYKDLAKKEELIGQQTAEIAQQKQTIADLRGEISQLQSEIAELNRKLATLEPYQDATFMAEAAEFAELVQGRANELLLKAKFLFDGQGNAPHGTRVVVTVNPELTGMKERLRGELEIMTAQWLSDELPEEQRAYNEAVIVPLLEDFEAFEQMLSRAQFRNAFEAALKLTGKIELLNAMNSESDGPVEGSPEALWQHYVLDQNVPHEWIDPGGALKDFFEVLGIDPVTEWSKSFDGEVKKAFRAHSREHHPDKGGDEDVFKRGATASDVLRDQEKCAAYLAAYARFQELFSS